MRRNHVFAPKPRSPSYQWGGCSAAERSRNRLPAGGTSKTFYRPCPFSYPLPHYLVHPEVELRMSNEGIREKWADRGGGHGRQVRPRRGRRRGHGQTAGGRWHDRDLDEGDDKHPPAPYFHERHGFTGWPLGLWVFRASTRETTGRDGRQCWTAGCPCPEGPVPRRGWGRSPLPSRRTPAIPGPFGIARRTR
jgi:hypothetical protein